MRNQKKIVVRSGFRHLNRAACLMLAVAPVVAAVMPGSALGATDTWSGAAFPDTTWTNAANWGGSTVVAGDSLIFSGTAHTPLATKDNFANGTLFGGIVFDGTAGAFTLNENTPGSDSIILGAVPIPPVVGDPNIYTPFAYSQYNSLVNNSTSLQTINIPMTLSQLSSTASVGGFHVINGGTGGLTINGAFSRSATSTATADFSGTVTPSVGSGLVNDTTGIIGGWATFNSSDLAAVNGGVISAYTGYTNVTGTGPFASTPGVNIKWTTATTGATLTPTGTTDMNTLTYSDAAVAATVINMNAGQTLRLGAVGTLFKSDATSNIQGELTIGNAAGTGFLTAGGSAIANNPGELILNANGNLAAPATLGNIDTIVINAKIVDNGTGSVTLIKTGASSVRTTALGTFTGPIYVDEGRLRSGVAGGFTTGNNSIFVANDSQLYYGTAGTASNNIFLAGVGVQEDASPNFIGGAMRLAANGVILTGTITLTDDARITGRSATGSGAMMSGQITGAHNLELGGAGTGVLILSNSTNNFTGNLTVSSGIVRLGGNEVIPNGAGFGSVIMNGDGEGSSGNTSTFDVFGHTETINGLTSSAATGAGTIVTNSTGAAGGGTLTIGDNNSSGTFNGTITDAGAAKSLSIIKIGTGIETLTNNNTYVGNTTITGGTIALSGSGAISSSTVITIGASGKLDASGIGTFSVAQNGTPQTLVNSGTEVGDISVNSNGVVTGTSAYGNVTLNGGNVSPGASANAGVVGTTTFGNLTVNGGSDVLDLTGAGDKIAVTGTLNLNSTLSLVATPTPVGGTYTIITAGTINNVSNIQIPTNSGRTTYSLDTSVANIVKLIVVGNAANLRWDNTSGGGDGSSWDNSNLNWFSTATSNPFLYFDGDNVTFNDTNHSNYNVNITSAVSPGSVTVSNSTNDYTIGGGSINGIGSLTKSGSRALNLTGANNYSGGTILVNGTLNLANGSAIGTGTLTLTGGTFDNTTGGLMTLTNGLTFNGSSTFAGAADASHDMTFSTGNVLVAGTSTLTIAGAGSTITIGGAITGANTLTKAGPGSLVLTGTNSFAGLTITGGTVRAAAASGAATVTVNSTGSYITTGTPTSNIVLAGGTLYPSAGNTTFAGNITLSPATTSTFVAGDPAANTVTINGNVTGVLHGSGTLLIQQTPGFVPVTGADGSQGFRLTGTVASDFSGTINVAAGAKFELASSIAGSFPVAGTGTIIVNPGTVALGNTLNGTYAEFNLRNNSAGNTTFGNNLQIGPGAGTVIVNALGTAPAGAVATMGNLNIADQQQLAIYLATTGPHVIAFNSVTLNGGTSTFSPSLPGFNNGTAPAGSNLFLSNIGQTASSNITMFGNSTLMIGGTSTFTGGVNINGGTVQVESSTAFGAATHNAFAFGNATTSTTGVLDLNGNSAVVGGLTDAFGGTANLITNTNPSSTAGTLVFSTATSTFDGLIQDGTSVTNLTVSSGSLTLSSIDTYSGTTSVSAGGTLSIATGAGISTASPVVNSGTINLVNPTTSIASLNGASTGLVNLNTTALTVVGGGTYAGGIADGGTGGRLIVPASTVLSTGTLTIGTLEADGKSILTSTTPNKIGALVIAGTYGGSASAASTWTGSLDLTNSKLIIEDSTVSRAADLAEIKDEALIANTTGNVGIYSSTALAFNVAAGKTVKVVAVVNNAARIATFPSGSTNFGGTNNVDASSILVTAAFKGDANLDGIVDIQDLTDVANHWQQTVTDWSQGDFDGNNLVDIQDLTAVANDWQDGVGGGGGSSLGDALSDLPNFGKTTATPEPMSLAVLGLGGLVLAGRRRRNRA